MRIRLFYRLDGGVSFGRPNPKSRRPRDTDTEWEDRHFADVVKDSIGRDGKLHASRYKGLLTKDIDDSELPSRRFRMQWVQSVNGVVPDLVKSRNQVLAELRQVRDKELTISDGKMAKENEIGTPQSQQDMKDYRQGLRDLPQNINAKLTVLDTVEELEQAYPKVLTVEEYLAK